LASNEALKHCGCDTRLAANTQQATAPGSERIFTDSLTGTSSRTAIAPAALCAGCGLLPRVPGLTAQVSRATQLNDVPGIKATDDILLSDRLIWHCACERCGPQPTTQQYEGQPARNFTDAITRCARCGQTAVTVDVRDAFTVAELIERFGNDPVPAQWGLVQDRLVQFGDPPQVHQQANTPRN
jgi:hypothetical protein